MRANCQIKTPVALSPQKMFLVCDKLIRNGKTEYTRLLIYETDRKRFAFGAQPDLCTPRAKKQSIWSLQWLCIDSQNVA